MSINYQKFMPVGGQQNNIVNPQDVASVAGTQPAAIAYATYITGTAAIVDITLPYTGFAGTIVLIPDAAFTWTTAGNIALAGTATAKRAIFFTYLPTKGKWYPSIIA